MLRRLTLLTLLTSIPVQALTTDDFSYAAGDYESDYSLDGRPHAAYNIADQLPSDILQNIYSMLPEGTVVDPSFIAENKSTSIAIDEELGENSYAEVSVTFLNEGAGYRNSLGYFVFDTQNPPATKDDIVDHVVIFPNASKPREGSMQEGDTLDLNIQLYPGQSIGFFVIPNGWGWSGSYNNIFNLGNWNTPFYSLTDLNPESLAINRKHNVVFVDAQNDLMVFGFEDLYRPGGDNDFNDLLFTVHVTPFTAVEGVNADGTMDSNYEVLTQKNATDITVTNVYPSSNSWATIAFEDRWPAKGDYDFNDVVMNYRITETLDGQRNLLQLDATYKIAAMGGDYHNGFALRLPNLLINDIASATLTQNGEPVPFEFIDENDGEVVFTISEDTRVDLENAGLINVACQFYRTLKHCLDSQVDTIEYSLQIEFSSPIDKSIVGVAPYDPFIFATPGFYHGDETGFQPGRRWETHLKQFSGSGFMDQSFFSIVDDASTQDNFFITSKNFPWAMNLTYPWAPPLESVDLSNAYRDFPLWVTSQGEQNTKWYLLENAIESKIAP